MTPPTPDEIALVKGAAVTARLYVTAALDQAEREAHLAVSQVFAKMRQTWLADLSADPPLKLLVLAGQAAGWGKGEESEERDLGPLA